jgi:hypothetical protein
MTPAEAAALLAVAAAFDNRKPDADAAKAWSIVLDGYRFEDCRDAIVAHYRVSSEWLMPERVIAAVKKVRGDRLGTAEPPSPPPGMDADDVAGYLAWLAAERQSIADGNPPTERPALPSRNLGDLKALMPKVPDVPRIATERDPEYARKRAAVEAELAARGALPTPETELAPIAPRPIPTGLDALTDRRPELAQAAAEIAANNPGMRSTCAVGGPPEASSDCVRDKGHRGEHRDTVGGEWPVPERPRFTQAAAEIAANNPGLRNERETR